MVKVVVMVGVLVFVVVVAVVGCWCYRYNCRCRYRYRSRHYLYRYPCFHTVVRNDTVVAFFLVVVGNRARNRYHRHHHYPHHHLYHHHHRHLREEGSRLSLKPLKQYSISSLVVIVTILLLLPRYTNIEPTNSTYDQTIARCPYLYYSTVKQSNQRSSILGKVSGSLFLLYCHACTHYMCRK